MATNPHPQLPDPLVILFYSPLDYKCIFYLFKRFLCGWGKNDYSTLFLAQSSQSL